MAISKIILNGVTQINVYGFERCLMDIKSKFQKEELWALSK